MKANIDDDIRYYKSEVENARERLSVAAYSGMDPSTLCDRAERLAEWAAKLAVAEYLRNGAEGR